MAGLTKLDEWVLLSVAATVPDSYGSRIAGEVPHAAQGSVYASLTRLESRGLLRSIIAPSLPQRGGRRRKVYTITPEAVQMLRDDLRRDQAKARLLDRFLGNDSAALIPTALR